MIRKKRGLSPVVATVLLVAMVVVIGLIIFLWFRGLTEESITKFGGQNVQLVCGDVYFEASYNNGNLYITNSGNVPIFGFKIKVQGDGSFVTQDIKDVSDSWSEAGLNQGGVFSDSITFDGNEIVLIPVLLGQAEDVKKTYVCDESQYGITLSV